MYEAKKIDDCIETMRDICVGNRVPVEFIGFLLEKELKEFGVKVNCSKTAQDCCDKETFLGEIPENMLMFNAFYDPDNEQEIELEVVFSKDYIQMTNEIFDSNKFEISLAVQHEMIHKYQNDMHEIQGWSQKIGSGRRGYLGDFDEIYARAHDVYLEWVNQNLPTSLLGSWNVAMFACPTLFSYMMVWGSNGDEPVLKRLMKLTYQFVMDGEKNEQTAGNI